MKLNVIVTVEWTFFADRAAAGSPPLAGHGAGRCAGRAQDAPDTTRRECLVSGVELHLVDGLINHAWALVKAAVAERPGCQRVSALKEPYRIEGKKTMGNEIAEQLGWQAPTGRHVPASRAPPPARAPSPGAS